MKMKSKFLEIWDFAVDTSPKHVNHGKAIDVLIHPCCNPADNEPMTLIAPHPEHGPWIAGGAALRWYQGQAVGENDIDVFCKDENQAKQLIKEIKSYGRYSTKFESENATTLSYYSAGDSSKTWVIQVITRRYFNDLKSVIDNFDITVCQIGTDGQNWLLGDHTAVDIRERNLRMEYPLQPDAAKRLVKYWTYGYRPVPNLLEAVMYNPIAKKEFQVDEDYQNAF